MTSVWPPSPKPREDSDPPEPEAMSTCVVGPRGTRYLDCGTVARVDRHIKMLKAQLTAHKKYPGRITSHWQDLDALLERRFQLQLETWLSPSDLPL